MRVRCLSLGFMGTLGPAMGVSVQPWRERMLDAFGGAGRKAVAFAV